MLRLHASLDASRESAFGALLREIERVRRVVRQVDESCEEARTVFVADVEPAGADRLIEEIGIGVDDYVLTRVDVVAQPGGALAVLAVNIALLICTGSLTLPVQRILPNHWGAAV